MKKTRKEIAYLLFTNPGGLTAPELTQKAHAKRPIKLNDPALASMLAEGVIELAGERYMLTDIGERAYID